MLIKSSRHFNLYKDQKQQGQLSSFEVVAIDKLRVTTIYLCYATTMILRTIDAAVGIDTIKL